MYILKTSDGIPHVVLVRATKISAAAKQYLNRIGATSIYTSQTEKHEKKLVTL